MDDYQVNTLIYGTFPEELKPQITKDIRVIEEYQIDLKTTTSDKPLFYTKLQVTVSAESDFDAKQKSLKIIDAFLGFYSVTTLSHFHILEDSNSLLEIIKLSGDRKTEPHIDFGYGIREDQKGKEFLDNVFPFHKHLQDKKNKYIKNSIDFLFRGRHTDEDKISLILTMISLETLFSKSNESGEIAFRLSNRVAVLLGNDIEERQKIRKTIDELYDMRSKIVHGVPIQNVDFKGMFIWVRQAILKFLQLSQKYETHDLILDQIDNAMMDIEIMKKLHEESSTLLNFSDNTYWGATATYRVILNGNKPAKLIRMDTGSKIELDESD